MALAAAAVLTFCGGGAAPAAVICPSPSPIPPAAAPRTYVGGEYGGTASVIAIEPGGVRVAVPSEGRLFWISVGVTGTTHLELRRRTFTRVGTAIAKDPRELPLAPGAPELRSGQLIHFGCPPGIGAVELKPRIAVAARDAPAGATAWVLDRALPAAVGAGTAITVETVTPVATLAALAPQVGDLVFLEFGGSPDAYTATLLARYVNAP